MREGRREGTDRLHSRARIISVGREDDAVVRLDLDAQTLLRPHSPRSPWTITPITLLDPAAFARAYASAIEAGTCPFVVNPQIPDGPREALLLSHGSPEARAPALGHLLCTSGTTREGGVPNVYFFDWQAALGNARAHLASIGVSGPDQTERFLLPTPIWHSFGVVAGLIGTLTCGGELYGFDGVPDPKTIVQTLERHEISTLYLNPTLARLILRSATRRALPPLPALRRVSIGAATMTRRELARLMDLIPNATFYFTYGLTEMGPRVTTFAAGSSKSRRLLLSLDHERPVPIGKPIEGVSCTVQNDRLVVTSPYAAHDLVSGGAFVTADAAAILPSGDLEVRGRVDTAIVTGGLNVYAEDVERAAMTVPDITHAVAVGVPSDLYGEIVVLLCVGAAKDEETSDSARDAALTAAFASALPPTHVPKAVHFVPKLPLTAAGKVLRRQAKALAASIMLKP